MVQSWVLSRGLQWKILSRRSKYRKYILRWEVNTIATSTNSRNNRGKYISDNCRTSVSLIKAIYAPYFPSSHNVPSSLSCLSYPSYILKSVDSQWLHRCINHTQASDRISLSSGSSLTHEGQYLRWIHYILHLKDGTSWNSGKESAESRFDHVIPNARLKSTCCVPLEPGPLSLTMSSFSRPCQFTNLLAPCSGPMNNEFGHINSQFLCVQFASKTLARRYAVSVALTSPHLGHLTRAVVSTSMLLYLTKSLVSL